MTNGDEVQFQGGFGDWIDATYIGVMSSGEIALENSDGLVVTRDPKGVRRKPKPQSICIIIYRDTQCMCPKDIYTVPFDTEGAARVYAFDRQLDVIKYITVEIPE